MGSSERLAFPVQMPDLPNLAAQIPNSTTSGTFSVSDAVIGIQQFTGPQGEEERHSVPRRGQVPAGQLLDLSPAIAEGVAVHVEILRRGFPPGVALEEGSQRKKKLGPVDAVVLIERGRGRCRRSQGIRILKREEQLLRPEVGELRLQPTVGPARLQRVPRLAKSLEEPLERNEARPLRGPRPGSGRPRHPAARPGIQGSPAGARRPRRRRGGTP